STIPNGCSCYQKPELASRDQLSAGCGDASSRGGGQSGSGGAISVGPTCLSSQRFTGAALRHAVVILPSDFAVCSQAGAPNDRPTCIPFLRSSSTRGWSAG